MAADDENPAQNQMELTVPLPEGRVKINVGGRRFETLESTLRRLPQSLLGDRQRRAPYFDSSTEEYFFDRSGAGFDAVLDVYRTFGGAVIRPVGISERQFADDLSFFGVGGDTPRGHFGVDSNMPVYQPAADGLRGRIWSVMQPSTGQPPVVPLISVVVTTVALLSWIVTAQPDMLEEASSCGLVQLGCVILLLAELIVRCVSCPQPIQLVLDPATYLDIIATLPFIIGIGIFESKSGEISAEGLYVLIREIPDTYLASIWLVRLSRLAWSLRLWRFLRATPPGELFKRVLIASAPQLGVWVALWLMGAVFFGACVYWAEEVHGHVISLPEAVYFAVISMTTVGYGDIYARTTAGRLLASLCAYYGYTMASLPIVFMIANCSVLRMSHQ